jgi:hypothetical protein
MELCSKITLTNILYNEVSTNDFTTSFFVVNKCLFRKKGKKRVFYKHLLVFFAFSQFFFSFPIIYKIWLAVLCN